MGTILVVYASADGSTAEVAQRLGEHLEAAGRQVTVSPVADDPDPALFDLVVAGSAIHDGAFLPDFTAFVDAHADRLRSRPVWLFSLGMGPALRGPIGAIFRGKVPPEIGKVRDQLGAGDYHQFGGRFDVPPDRGVRVVMWLMGAKPGDHRDWSEVAQWADTIAAAAAG
ncbi:flavodoxin domain-containing protein [Gordonia sp. ABSL1-1]|uniref:flavodoxin domain-containing protein n=1 Tax=Gordonia sp. ABSL1-1 TaxID=3053923 RepID=UPI0025738E29|nr:flavodoxin domain-containing protein [Gordonia sp. ABSL1-1]MDL9938157.1 flavodoxin domain-containing protein [Gordonia sp. ABSL1-1]